MADSVRELHDWFLRKSVQAQQMAASAALKALTGLEEERADAADRALACKTRSQVWALAADKLREAAGFADAQESADVLAPEPTEEDSEDT